MEINFTEFTIYYLSSSINIFYFALLHQKYTFHDLNQNEIYISWCWYIKTFFFT